MMPAAEDVDERIRRLSLWHDTHDGSFAPRPALGGDVDVDVTIVGGGYSGLWTAYYLRRLDPTLRVVVIEREIVGFGASGRNGGWCIGEVAASPDVDRAGLVQRRGPALPAAKHTGRSTRSGTSQRPRASTATSRRGAPCIWRATPPTSTANEPRVAHHQQAFGLTDDDLRMLGAAEAAARVGATSVLGAMFFAHTAALHPVRLVRGLAEAVERHGGVIVEGTSATSIEAGRCRKPPTGRSGPM